MVIRKGSVIDRIDYVQRMHDANQSRRHQNSGETHIHVHNETPRTQHVITEDYEHYRERKDRGSLILSVITVSFVAIWIVFSAIQSFTRWLERNVDLIFNLTITLIFWVVVVYIIYLCFKKRQSISLFFRKVYNNYFSSKKQIRK